ncbi:potassium-transporting ATPase subunit KdpC [Comamonas humi]
MKTLIRPAISLLLVLTVVTGGLYPAVVTGLAQGLFPHQAHGSLVVDDGRAVGSELIGQNFGAPKYFWPRPSATSPEPYNAANSGGSNLGPLNPALQEAVRARIEALKAVDPGNAQPVPVDLVTASASGLDPHISVAAARYQAARVARVRQLPASTVDALVAQHTEAPLLGFLGEERVNVLALNRALDRMAPR